MSNLQPHLRTATAQWCTLTPRGMRHSRPAPSWCAQQGVKQQDDIPNRHTPADRLVIEVSVEPLKRSGAV